jgi:purine-nucleoside phosphorylase
MSLTTLDLAPRASETAAAIRNAVAELPPIAIVLGSGLGSIADGLSESVSIPYTNLPHMPAPTVAGHAGQLVVGAFEGGARILALQGRYHYYEGLPLLSVTFPIRVLQFLGVKTLILTAACGGVRPELRPGNLVVLQDHLNLIGVNPLRGPHDDRLGSRFVDLTEVYSKKLRSLARDEAKRIGVDLIPGVYACLPGPSYETPAEIRMLRALGADVVGMSTVPEAIVARQAGMEILALALVTNPAAGVVGTPISHREVLEAGKKATPILAKLIRRVVCRLSGIEPGKTGLTGDFPTIGGNL